MHQAFQWVLDPDHDPATADAPQVVNGVLGARAPGRRCNLAFQPDVQALRAAGILPVFSAGNFGPTAATSASPANYPESLSVGAVGATDMVWAYSSAGPSTCGGRTRVFPDLVAPGVSVLSADRFGGLPVPRPAPRSPRRTSRGPLRCSCWAPTPRCRGAPGARPDRRRGRPRAAGPDERYGNGRLDVMAADARAATDPGLRRVGDARDADDHGGRLGVDRPVTVAPAKGFATPHAVGAGAAGRGVPVLHAVGARAGHLGLHAGGVDDHRRGARELPASP